MKSSAKYIAAVLFLFSPVLASAQSVGQVACTRQDNYTYLYSSMTTLEVQRTLQCGEQVDITGRYEGYFGVRTAKGEVGYVPLSSLLLLKDKPGPRAPQPPPQTPGRPRTAYDTPAAPVAPPPAAIPSDLDLTLLNGTPIHLKLKKTISSATAHVGEVVELEVLEEVLVDGVCVIPAGAMAVGIVTEAEPKKHMGHGGKLGVGVNFVRLGNNEKAAVRSFQEGTGANTPAGTVLPLAHGKDVVFAQGMEFTAYVDGDMHLKKASFQRAKDAAAPTSAAQNPSQPPEH